MISCCRRRKFTNDEHIFIFGPYTQHLSRALMNFFATLILILPVIILNFMSNIVGRLVITIFAAALFVLAVSLLAKAGTAEVLAAGAA